MGGLCKLAVFAATWLGCLSAGEFTQAWKDVLFNHFR